MMNILAIIPARGGSISVSKKNIKLLGGKPLIAYSIEEAKQSKFINRIIVSTDSDEISAVAGNYNAEVPFKRPAELAKNDTLDLPVFVHALEWLKENENYVPDIIVHLRPTSPLRKAFHIDEAVEMLINRKGDVVKSVSLVKNHPHKMWRIAEGRLVAFCKNETWKKYGPDVPRQQLEPLYRHNGAVDVFEPSVLKNSVYEDLIYLPYIMEDRYSVDLDTEEDFLYAGILLKNLTEKNG